MTEFTIMVPLDGSRRAEVALTTAGNFARWLGGRLLLVRNQFVPPVLSRYPAQFPMLSQDFARESQECREYLESQAEPLRRGGMTVTTALVHGLYPAHSLSLVAKRLKVTLMVLTSSGRGQGGGTVARALGHQAPCPVLMVDSSGRGRLLTQITTQPCQLAVVEPETVLTAHVHHHTAVH